MVLNAAFVVEASDAAGAREVVAERVRDDEVTVGEALHEGGRAERFGSVVGEVRSPRQTSRMVVCRL